MGEDVGGDGKEWGRVGCFGNCGGTGGRVYRVVLFLRIIRGHWFSFFIGITGVL